MQNPQSRTGPTTASANVPAIITDILKIKVAREMGDLSQIRIAKQQFNAKVDGLQASQWEKGYNKVSTAYQKALKDYRDKSLEFDKFQQSQELQKTNRESIAKENVARTAARASENVEKIKQRGSIRTEQVKAGATTGAADITGQWGAEEQRIISQREMDLQDDEQKFKLDLYGELKKRGVPDRLIDSLMQIGFGGNQLHKEVAIFDRLADMERTGEINREERKELLKITENIDPDDSSSGSGGFGTMIEGEKELALQTLVNLIRTNVEVPVSGNYPTRFRKDKPKTVGENSTPEELEVVADQMKTAIQRAKWPPQEILILLQSDFQDARDYKVTRMNEDLTFDTPDSGQTVEFGDRPGQYPDPDDQAAALANINAQRSANQKVLLYDSPAGRALIDWLDESARVGYYLPGSPPRTGSPPHEREVGATPPTDQPRSSQQVPTATPTEAQPTQGSQETPRQRTSQGFGGFGARSDAEVGIPPVESTFPQTVSQVTGDAEAGPIPDISPDPSRTEESVGEEMEISPNRFLTRDKRLALYNRSLATITEQGARKGFYVGKKIIYVGPKQRDRGKMYKIVRFGIKGHKGFPATGMSLELVAGRNTNPDTRFAFTVVPHEEFGNYRLWSPN